jgi:hypothetical protein
LAILPNQWLLCALPTACVCQAANAMFEGRRHRAPERSPVEATRSGNAGDDE